MSKIHGIVKHLVVLFFLFGVSLLVLNAQKIELKPSMLTTQYKSPTAINLVDEQVITGDPTVEVGGNPSTFWNTGSAAPYPLYAIFDLKTTFNITKILLRDSYNEGIFEVFAGKPGEWRQIAIDNLTGQMQWNVHEVNAKTQYLKFQKNEPGANVAEVLVYGNPLSAYGKPNKVADLKATWLSDTRVQLEWTAPASNVIQLAGYEIRFANETIVDSIFYTYKNHEGIVDLVRPGEKQTVTISGLSAGKTYYFALKSFDTNNVMSDLSNNTKARALEKQEAKYGKITLTPDMVLNEHAQGDATHLVDEQHLLGATRVDKRKRPVTPWDATINQFMYPCFALIDLKGFYHIKEIYLHDAWSQKTKESFVNLFYGEPFNWRYFATDSLHQNDAWKRHPVDVKTRYLRIALHSPDSRINEIALYGTKLSSVDEEVKTKPKRVLPKPTIGDMLGVNAFASDPLGLVEVSTFVREYHDWFWNDGNAKQDYPGFPDNRLEFVTMGIDFDLFYKNLQNMNIGVVPCIQHGVPYLYNWDFRRLQDHPVYTGKDPESPSSYEAHADFLYQYVARYGSRPLPEEALKLEKGQIPYTGLNTVKYFENYNEHDKWWKGKNAFFTPYQFMAMTSADYDGHDNAMGSSVGVKNADPNAKFVMSGLAKSHLDYIKAMKLWADYNRGGDILVDVLNIHHYCNDEPNQIGISPEEGKLRELLEEFVEYRDLEMPDKEIWLSEFGYDTHFKSPQRSPEIGHFSADEVQGMWLVRSVLEMAASGIDKGMMYMLRDVNTADSTRYFSSGLVRSKDLKSTPKEAWYYYATIKNNLSNMIFHKEMETNRKDVKVYRFYDKLSGLGAYAVWCPTSSSHEVLDYRLKLQPNEFKAQQIMLKHGSKVGEKSELLVDANSVQVNVSELPTFILTADNGYEFPKDLIEKKYPLKTSWVSQEAGVSGAVLMVNEQDLIGDPLEGLGGEPKQPWEPGYQVQYPVHGFIDLQAVKHVSKIVLFDSNASDMITLSIGRPGNWEEVARDNLTSYNQWKTHIIDQKTRFIRVTLTGSGSLFNELGVYIKE